ncbi:diguanylate cyclase (GGDEF)-like protein/PAS domain S-box-containing protein [Bradyrhizobium japonicum]|uniref:Diguanylate cyclase (GGDEF)-like protein/PAS domain S-box-containing protein n=1 Tax=Bradyrhizobium elkanii TaxID=29448 RepID=A0ABV4FBQ7_BRAEL|nr:EAL domain-containing protein [Bradyrhizobium elkanii]MBP2432151.1 diguanylate cyclase (GGDEF)-like protein/PAS domain S-box-containing protein [Bradyrhizobium elkanii]MCP1734527.1 diguanylate cyclase (GGDEF)-like protein/PAS domain S-box-containing protein [Bradyrhizobium elkanii]MCP1752321.1 diguanylate cyclase (GGDEF)-like protein/PAS domain S-box-containing protein [Bradyrhizobium elkanii]MCP1978094.1 diguanylate cyclase (GGDEF)-like protein/PAS domain S-box-containing protein [Bradyrhiz
MAGRKVQAGGKNSIPARAVLCLIAAVAPCAAARAGTGAFAPSSYLGSLDPGVVWELLIGSVVVASFFGAVGLWILSALRKAKRAQLRRNAFVSSALNHLNQGVVMTDAQERIVFCNDRYLDIYGLSRADIRRNMTGVELLELRRDRGVLDLSAEDFFARAAAPEGLVTELPGGRSVLVKYFPLPNGGSVATHLDCTDQRKLSRKLASTTQFLESVLDNVPVCVAAKNIEDGRYIFANRAFERFSRFSRDHIVGKRADEIFRPETAASIDTADHAALNAAEGYHRSEFFVERGSDKRILASNRVIARNEAGEPEFLIALFEDVTDRRSLSRELENNKKFLELVVDNIPVSLIVQRVSDGRYLLANRSAETILNRRREDAAGLTASDIFNAREAKLIIARDEAAIRKRSMIAEEHPISTKDGLRLFLTRRMTVLDDVGEPQYLIKTHEDVTDRRQTESRMAHMAYHDGLTDLPNRAAFLQALTQMIEACDGTDEEFAVLCVDLDGLKEINDVYGHAMGDKVLIEVAQRLQTVARGGVVARLSGDEFGLIIDGKQPVAGIALAEQAAEALGQDFLIDGKSVRTGLTTGIAVFPDNGSDAASLLANSGAALFRAKAKSRGTISIFEPEMDQQIRDRRVLHQELSVAIKNGELSLYYQPQAAAGGSVAASQIIGFEALARWHHPVRGFVPPGDFIPLAEESGLIVEMGEWILREACREAASWAIPLQVAVNLSPAQFTHGDLVGLVHSILLETGLTPDRLELEITEGVLIEDFDRGLSLLRRLKALGVRISMDDFGSGYSSLSYLQAFPFDKIKIDRAFVINLGRNPQSAAIVRAVIDLGHGLEMSIVAEGVETEAQLGFLAEEGCDAVQGYLIGRPAPIGQFAALVGGDRLAETVRRAG